VIRWARRRYAAAMCRHRSPSEAEISRTRSAAISIAPARRSVVNVKRGVARTAFSMAAGALRRRRCLLVTCRRSRQFAGRWHARNMRKPKVHRSAKNLCILTIVNEALYHNPNIHLQVRASQPAAECRARIAVDREPGRLWRPEHDAGRVDGNCGLRLRLPP
jgi:hypothetical protein